VTVLVTGCAGFIGSHLTESLLADGVDVVGVDCLNDTYSRDQKLSNLAHARHWDRFSFMPVDLTQVSLDDVVADVDIVFHLAAEPGVRASWGTRFETYLRNNVLATQILLESVKRVGACRFIFASSSSIYGEAETFPTSETISPRPYSPYGVTKLGAEHLCHAYASNYGVDAGALRYFSVYGPRQRPDMAFHQFCRAALERRPIHVFGDGEQSREFSYVTDVVRATRAAGEVDQLHERVFNVGGGGGVTVNEAIGVLSQLTGRPLEVVYTDRGRGDVLITRADTERARRLLGFTPSVGIREGLTAQYEWMRERLDEEANNGGGIGVASVPTTYRPGQGSS
jgi:nucleoside-diphosphate-sugar epimerase